MGKAPGKYRKWCRIFCALLLIGSLLLAGCASKPNEQGQTQPPETSKAAEVSDATQGTQTDGTEPTADTSAESSLASLRQAMAETPQLFAAAFFGYAAQDADPFAVMQEAPFTDKGDVVDVFSDSVVWVDIMQIIKAINANAL